MTEHFKLYELISSDLADEHGLLNCPPEEEFRTLRKLARRLLQPLRNAYGKPIRISSGYREPELNRLVGGSPTSQHLTGEAADCVVDDPEHLLVVLLENKIPFDQAILYRKRGFLHLSLKKKGRNRKEILFK